MNSNVESEKPVTKTPFKIFVPAAYLKSKVEQLNIRWALIGIPVIRSLYSAASIRQHIAPNKV